MVRKYTDKELLDKVQELESFTEFPKGKKNKRIWKQKNYPTSSKKTRLLV